MTLIYLALSISLLLAGTLSQKDSLLFNGVTLDNWEVLEYEEHGPISVADSCIIIGRGEMISGIRWTNDFPNSNYEVSLEGKRVEGSDFFCGMTFPVSDSFLTLVLGGWGGSLVGLSSIDGYDAANNLTGQLFYFESHHWYKIRLRVTQNKVEAWIDNEKIVDFAINNSYLSLRWEVEASVPFGFTTYKTTGALKNIRVRELPQ